jgi:D-arabinose 1-dehydrogenase-like Zn-dependent alcohol dehydrogenase
MWATLMYGAGDVRVEDVGSEVSGLKPGDVVVAPFVWADNTCDFCREGLQTSCRPPSGSMPSGSC